VILHGLYTLKMVLARHFGHEFDDEMDNLINARTDIFRGEEGNLMTIYGMSETAKVLNRIALMTRDIDTPHEVRRGKDYIQDPGGAWIELRVERCYDKYKRYCVAHGDTALYDTLEQFIVALSNFDPVIDKVCANSDLREDGSTENIIRLSGEKMRRLGIRAFRY
jgi:hypothetical protein